jgi:4-amino-4-deoxy-L-arabinose transferase-like glycosyltransferase
MALASGLLAWGVHHTETSFADGLRYIHQAERIDAGSWHEAALRGTDHPVHPLAVAATHQLMGDRGPISWQRAAFLLAFCSTVLLVVPIYMLTLELYGETAAGLACLLVIINPLSSYVVVNVLSESTFLLPWTFGLWAAVRFLRDGGPAWLMLAIAFAGVAYLTRPEGLLLAVALCTTLVLLQFFRSTRFERPRSWRLITGVVIGVLVLAGPYVALRGGLGTKPGIARVLALAPQSTPLALEREKPQPVDQPLMLTYRLATIRMLKVLRAAVTPELLPPACFGLLLLPLQKTRLRATLFLAIVMAASAIALVRLHATGGYCTTRHGLIPGVILTVAAAGALAWLASKCRIPGRWLGLKQHRVGLAAPIWTVLLAGVVLATHVREMQFMNRGPFEVYRATAAWLSQNAIGADRVLDMTDWSLYFSALPGYHFADVHKAPGDPATRWIVVRAPHVEGRWHYAEVIRALIGDREPVARFPDRPAPGQLQVRIYDRRQQSGPFADQIARSSSDKAASPRLQQPRAIPLHTDTQIPPAQSTNRGNGS